MAKGKRAASRRGKRKPPTFQPVILGLAAGVTLAVVAWGYLVWAAIDFGSTARGGDSQAWGFLALASAGAIACLFAGLMLGARLLQALGLIDEPSTSATEPTSRPAAAEPAAPRVPGGRRAAR